ncbi:MAG: uridine kinase [Jatrophihabitantaceae bacterium]
MSGYRPVSRDVLIALLAERINRSTGLVRVAIDGPAPAAPHELAGSLVDPLRALGRPVHLVRAETFWHDASLRLEYGHEDADSYLGWLDAQTLRREVLDPVTTSGSYLPSLRDPATNRATRERPRTVEPNAVLVVSGELLLGLGLPFELTVHLAMSPGARARRIDPELAWTLPAFDRYDAEVAPQERADLVVRVDDPDRPAVR